MPRRILKAPRLRLRALLRALPLSNPLASRPVAPHIKKKPGAGSCLPAVGAVWYFCPWPGVLRQIGISAGL